MALGDRGEFTEAGVPKPLYEQRLEKLERNQDKLILAVRRAVLYPGQPYTARDKVDEILLSIEY